MKNIKLKEVSKILQKNYNRQLKKDIDIFIKLMNWENRTSISGKIAQNNLLTELYKCLSIGNKIPIIESNDANKFIKPFRYSINFTYYEKFVLSTLKRRIPTLDYIFKDLVYLRKEFNGIKFKKNILYVTTHDIILKDINFGPFEISLKLNLNLFKHANEVYVNVKAIKPNYSGGDSRWGNPHPHVNGNSLCLGIGRFALFQSLKDLRLLDYFQIINSILNTYGKDPYEYLEAWSSNKCGDCDDYITEDNTCACAQCEEDYCHSCTFYCTLCDSSLCRNCNSSFSCGDCFEGICCDCVTKCNICDAYSCTDCILDSCCGEICGKCGEECYNCNGIVCKNCQGKCSECGDIICKSCAIGCDSCDYIICEVCNIKCLKCNSNYHEKCEYICCD